MERIPYDLRRLTGGYTPLRFASVGMTAPFEDVAHVDSREGCPYDVAVGLVRRLMRAEQATAPTGAEEGRQIGV